MDILAGYLLTRKDGFASDQLNTFRTRRRRRKEEQPSYTGVIIASVIFTVYITALIIAGLIGWMGVIIIAVKCNPESPVGYGILAALFTGFYFAQWSVKKVMLNKEGYCMAL
jgi:hypothetical protein